MDPDPAERTRRREMVGPMSHAPPEAAKQFLVGGPGRIGGRHRRPSPRSSTRCPTSSGMAFVVILHLSPEHESNLAAVLQRHTAMPVIQVVRETQKVQPNHVYVIPPAQYLTMTDGHIHLRESAAGEGPPRPGAD